MRTASYRPLEAKAAPVDVLPGANKGERRYAAHLDVLKAAGTVAEWWWAPGSIRLAPSLHYQPDFLVQLADATLTLVDVKGAKGERFHVEEDSWAKIKTVAAMYPYRVLIVWERKGVWCSEVVGKTAA